MQEILRRLENIIQFGTICEIDNQGRALAKIKLMDRVTDFMPVLSFANAFKIHFIPIRIDEQVAVLCPYGNADKGLIIRGIFNTNKKEPSGSNDHTEVAEFEDGTKVSYDSQAKLLKTELAGDTQININGNAIIEVGGNAEIKANQIDLEAANINLKGIISSGEDGGSEASHNGNLIVNGNIEATGSIIDGTGNSNNHTH